jgi:folylpolyglutamate synthase/dihydropteroate synthase
MALAEELAGPDGVVLVTGSLFTVGEALERLGLA